MRTTLDLPDPLFKEVKMRAVQQGVKLKDLLAAYVEAGLRGTSSRHAPGSTEVQTRSFPVAIRRVPGTPLHPARTNAELSAILEKEDLDQYRRVAGQIPTDT